MIHGAPLDRLSRSVKSTAVAQHTAGSDKMSKRRKSSSR